MRTHYTNFESEIERTVFSKTAPSTFLKKVGIEELVADRKKATRLLTT